MVNIDIVAIFVSLTMQYGFTFNTTALKCGGWCKCDSSIVLFTRQDILYTATTKLEHAVALILHIYFVDSYLSERCTYDSYGE